MIVRKFFKILYILFLSCSYQILAGSDHTREIETNLSTLTQPNARGYLMPLMEAHIANINRSTYHTAEIENELDIYIGMKAMVTIVPDRSKTFAAESQTSDSGKRTATIVGTTGNDEFPDGFNWSVVPVMIPQMHIGNLYGTQFVFRYLPTTKFDDKIGNLDVFGGGITHSLSQYLPEFPLHLAVQGFYQQTKLGNVFESSGTMYNFLASARFSGLTVYGGIGYENTDINVEYEYNPGEEQAAFTDILPERIKFNESFDDQFRATLGMSLQFIIFSVNADFSFGNYHVASVGLGISI